MKRHHEQHYRDHDPEVRPEGLPVWLAGLDGKIQLPRLSLFSNLAFLDIRFSRYSLFSILASPKFNYIFLDEGNPSNAWTVWMAKNMVANGTAWHAEECIPELKGLLVFTLFRSLFIFPSLSLSLNYIFFLSHQIY